MLIADSDLRLRRALVRRDARYDGAFVYAVTTTGIYCRPSCPSPRPKPQHLRLFSDWRSAQAAGYRPCKRCHPQQADGALPGWMRRLIAQLDAAPDGRLGEDRLRALGLTPARVRRAFRSRFGITFAAYARQRRMHRAYRQLCQGRTVVETALDHGFESERGFRAAFVRAFATTPGDAGGVAPISVDWLPSPLGALLLGVDDAGVRLVDFGDGGAELPRRLQQWRRRLGRPLLPGAHPLLEAARTQLQDYFAGRRRRFELPLAPSGTVFQRRVWEALCAIPYGATRSYADIAAAIGRPRATRAVGSANGANPIAVLIPCHRVVNASGALGGYGGGVWRKRLLLELERRGAADEAG